MTEVLTNWYLMLKSIQLFPEVTAACLASYFVVRQRYDSSVKWAVWVPVIVSYIGQMSFAWPQHLQGAFQCLTMGLIQAGLAIGAYSFLDKYGITDRFGRLVQKKIDDKTGGDNAPK